MNAMKMKKFGTVMVAALLLVAGFVPVAQAAVSVQGDAYVGYYDKYVWRGFDLSGAKPVVQGGVDLSLKGVTLSYWSNLQQTDGKMTETDITLDYAYEVSPLLTLNGGNIHYALDGIDDTNELYLKAAFNTLLNPSVAVYWDYFQASKAGLFYTVSVGHTFALTKELGLNLGALASYNQDSDYSVGAYSAWHDYELSASLAYALTDQITITPSVLFTEGISTVARNAIGTQWQGGVSTSFSF
jgi:uncharacterized protein (TIGR02001 family)